MVQSIPVGLRSGTRVTVASTPLLLIAPTFDATIDPDVAPATPSTTSDVLSLYAVRSRDARLRRSPNAAPTSIAFVSSGDSEGLSDTAVGVDPDCEKIVRNSKGLISPPALDHPAC